MKQMSFSEYVNSKQKLREAVRIKPQKTRRYSVRRPCRLMVRNSKGKKYLPLNKGQIVNVVWLYDNRKKPIPMRIFFSGVKTIDEDERFYTTWSGEKLESWLGKNAFLL